MPFIINTFAGDTSPVETFTIKRANGSTVDLTGATVKFKILNPETEQRTNDSGNTMAVTNPSAGQCQYTWSATDCPVEGAYQANIQITFPSGKIETTAGQINVQATV